MNSIPLPGPHDGSDDAAEAAPAAAGVHTTRVWSPPVVPPAGRMPYNSVPPTTVPPTSVPPASAPRDVVPGPVAEAQSAHGGGRLGWRAPSDRSRDVCPRVADVASVDAPGLLVLVCRTANRVAAYLNRELAGGGLDWATAQVLLLTAAQERSDPHTIGTVTGLTVNDVQRMLTGLAGMGLVRPTGDDEPGAGVVTATPAGVLLTGYLQRRVDAVQARLLGTGGPGCLLRRVATRLPPPPPQPQPPPAPAACEPGTDTDEGEQQ